MEGIDVVVFHLILNAYWEPLDFELPDPADGAPRRRWIETAHDVIPWQTAPAVPGGSYWAEARSVVTLDTGIRSGLFASTCVAQPI